MRSSSAMRVLLLVMCQYLYRALRRQGQDQQRKTNRPSATATRTIAATDPRRAAIALPAHFLPHPLDVETPLIDLNGDQLDPWCLLVFLGRHSTRDWSRSHHAYRRARYAAAADLRCVGVNVDTLDRRDVKLHRRFVVRKEQACLRVPRVSREWRLGLTQSSQAPTEKLDPDLPKR